MRVEFYLVLFQELFAPPDHLKVGLQYSSVELNFYLIVSQEPQRRTAAFEELNIVYLVVSQKPRRRTLAFRDEYLPCRMSAFDS